jgi:hypothetical protein
MVFGTRYLFRTLCDCFSSSLLLRLWPGDVKFGRLAYGSRFCNFYSDGYLFFLLGLINLNNSCQNLLVSARTPGYRLEMGRFELSFGSFVSVDTLPQLLSVKHAEGTSSLMKLQNASLLELSFLRTGSFALQ